MKRLTRLSLSSQSGFTLVELLLAMTLFVSVMVISTVGFIAMNRTFTRGTIRKQLSEAVQLTTEDATRMVRQMPQGSVAVPPCVAVAGNPTPSSGCPAGGWNAMCVTGARYLWKNDGNNGGLWKDNAKCQDNVTVPDNSLKLVNERYKVIKFAIMPVADPVQDHLFRIEGTFRTEDDSAFNYPNEADKVKCKGSAQSSAVRTCAVERFNFIIDTRGEVSS